jgi:hypothetical protein
MRAIGVEEVLAAVLAHLGGSAPMSADHTGSSRVPLGST